MKTVELKDHFFRIQTSKEIPVDGYLLDIPIELCHQLSIVDDTGKALGTSQGGGILSIGTPTELNADFPFFSEYMEYIKIALVTKAMQILASRKDTELAASKSSKNTGNTLKLIE